MTVYFNRTHNTKKRLTCDKLLDLDKDKKIPKLIRGKILKEIHIYFPKTTKGVMEIQTKNQECVSFECACYRWTGLCEK